MLETKKRYFKPEVIKCLGAGLSSDELAKTDLQECFPIDIVVRGSSDGRVGVLCEFLDDIGVCRVRHDFQKADLDESKSTFFVDCPFVLRSGN